jgi:hypothetical protein
LGEAMAMSDEMQPTLATGIESHSHSTLDSYYCTLRDS